MLDDIVQTTEADEFIYHEMLTHPLLFSIKDASNVLIIGGGDGGILREVLKHKKINAVTMVEIDAEVIEASKKYLKSICGNSFNSKKLKLIIDDGAKFVKKTKEQFDLVIVDSPDPVAAARVLFSKTFYKDIEEILTPQGALIRQTGSTMWQPKIITDNYHKLSKIFPVTRPQISAIPTYVGGFFSCLIGGKKIDPAKIAQKTIKARYAKAKIKTKYYNPQIHFASLMLPNYLKGVTK
jgi:spermidine synthase